MRSTRRYWAIPLLLALLLAACGTSGTPQPAAGDQPAGEQPGGLPLPGSEKTRIAQGTSSYTAIASETLSGAAQPALIATTPAPPTLTYTAQPASPTASFTAPATLPPTAVPTAVPTQVAAVASPLPPTPTGFPLPLPTDIPGKPIRSALPVRFLTEDGIELAGSLYLPGTGEPPYPAAILLPMHIEDRRAWEPVASQLAQAGIAGLAIDLRGQGSTDGPADWSKAENDVLLVWKVLGEREDIDERRIVLIGASIGANVALNAAAAEPAIAAVVLLSPSQFMGGVDTSDAVRMFGERPLLIINSENDPITGAWPAWILSRQEQHYTLRTYPGTTHGTFLLSERPRLINYIIDWLSPVLVKREPPVAAADEELPRATGGAISWLRLVFALLGCATGGLLWLVAAALIVARFRRRLPSAPLTIAEIAGRPGWHDLYGTITHTASSLEGGSKNPLVALRLRIESPNGEGGWHVWLDRTHSSSFSFSDGASTAYVDPLPDKFALLGPGQTPTLEQKENARDIMNLDKATLDELSLPPEERLKYTLWELRVGDQVVISAQSQPLAAFNTHAIGPRPENVQIYALSALQDHHKKRWTRGRVATVPEAVGELDGRQLAILRLLIEDEHPDFGRSTVYDETVATPFFMTDDQAQVLVFPGDGVMLSGPGIAPDDTQIEAARQILGFDPLPEGRQYHYTMWPVAVGDIIWTSGQIDAGKILSAREADRSQDRRPLQTIDSLGTGQGWVRLRGKIANVPEPIDDRRDAPLAALRVVVEEEVEGRWETRYDQTTAVRFSLEDPTGTIWVLPENLHPDLFGKGLIASPSQAAAALQLQNQSPNLAWSNRSRFKIWELRGGQEVTITGNFRQVPVLVMGEKRDLPALPRSWAGWRHLLTGRGLTSGRGRTARFSMAGLILIAMFGMGLALLCLGGVSLLQAFGLP